MTEDLDVIVVGAGLSGVSAAWHLQHHCPDRSYAILEGRQAIGGTWDLFRYPGIRSDSDMHTLGFAFRPWTEAKAIADGPSIRRYVVETAREHAIDEHIRFGRRVTSAEWSTPDARWTVRADGPDGPETFTCGFLFMCSGYYDYDRAHAPIFPGQQRFTGTIVHPQFWPEDLEYAGKRVVVIGSGATAMTLAPELAKTAAHVTMLQRSPTYVVSRPSHDGVADWLRGKLPARLAYRITRWKNVLLGLYFYRTMRRRPGPSKEKLVGMVRDELGQDYDVATHFTPRYNPWDQRMCLVPDADLFAAIKAGTVSVATDTIQSFTEDGIALASGGMLPADIIVTATGLELKLAGGATFSVDGARVDLAKTMNYKGMMFSNVPNLAASFGYTNASWTLKADLTSRYICRLLNVMRRRGMRQCTPRVADASISERPFSDLSSGYIQRSIDTFPKQGSKKPWRVHQNYALDLVSLRFGSVDASMEFASPEPTRARARENA